LSNLFSSPFRSVTTVPSTSKDHDSTFSVDDEITVAEFNRGVP
jgi:hypothetical protein